jgi:pyruvyl transferase EpsO
MSSHNIVMTGLKSSLYELTKTIKHKKIIYIDYPMHHNIGDLLIYLGAMQLLKESGVEVLAQFTAANTSIDKVQKIIATNNQEVSLVFHGGGNFGDIYTAHQDCRLLLIEHFPQINTVVFPQTIFYENQTKKNSDINIFRKHADLTIAVRDIKSESIALEFCDSVYLFPDTAHMLWPSYFKGKDDQTKSTGKLKLNRWDCEGDNQSNKDNFDWALIIKKSDNYFKAILNRISARNKFLIIDKLIAYLWLQHCKNICQRAADYFEQYDEIETNRLHGHILSCLLSKKNIVLDNSYGKNFTYLQQWTKQSNLVKFQTKEGQKNER